MFKFYKTFFLLLVTATCSFAQSPNLSWINTHATPIDSSGKNDKNFYAALSTELKGNTIVGLAEASHGTREFSIEKTRIIKYLIEHENYKAVGFEFGYSPMAAINSYVQTGKGNLTELMQPLRLFKTQEFLELFKTIKAYNDGQPAANKVTVFGFDTDYFPTDIKASAAYCKKYLIEHAGVYKNEKTAATALESIARPDAGALYELADGDVEGLAALLEELKAKGVTGEFVKRLSLLYQGTLLGNPLARDEFMAQNLAGIQGESKAKTIIWGHNMHLAKDTTMAACKGMGYYVKKKYAEKYYAVAFDTFTGTVNVLDEDDFVEHPFTTQANSYSAVFATAKYPEFFLPLKNIDNNPLFGQTNNITNIYASWNRSGVLPMRPGIDYDGVVFIRDTRSSVPLK
ncbi:erythromycin esterase family protein [Mucilaginibacter pedocola]|uniref:Erythromycin esterase n=1 Tax=Mucilaginibacter pedocola TaxID=1792845 RepID=A0A1S9PFJ8_9SPHI|nr:erythromycin esterase family protein [Mucilaginibacter pedocola]OOQ59726.1 hypothetical protein BC343_06055 [Mucilaginibacter pedocola]